MARPGYPEDFGEEANSRLKYLPNSSLTEVHGDSATEIGQHVGNVMIGWSRRS